MTDDEKRLAALLARAAKLKQYPVFADPWIPFDGPPEQRYMDWLAEEIAKHEASLNQNQHLGKTK